MDPFDAFETHLWTILDDTTVSVNGRQSIESAISRLRTDINTECSPAVLPDQDSMLSGLLEIYERYTPILPRHLRATTDSPEESPSSIGRQTDEPCAISALTAEIEQLEFERDAVLDALRQYEEEGHARDGGPDVSLALAEVAAEEVVSSAYFSSSPRDSSLISAYRNNPETVDALPPVSPNSKEEFQQKIRDLNTQVSCLQTKLRHYEQLLMPAMTQKEVASVPSTSSSQSAPSLGTRLFRQVFILLHGAYQACAVLLWSLVTALGIDKFVLFVLVSLGGILQIAWILAGILPWPLTALFSRPH